MHETVLTAVLKSGGVREVCGHTNICSNLLGPRCAGENYVPLQILKKHNIVA